MLKVEPGFAFPNCWISYIIEQTQGRRGRGGEDNGVGTILRPGLDIIQQFAFLWAN